MIVLYTMLVMLVCSLVFLNVYRLREFIASRRGGASPQKGRPTMFDVRQLLMEGKKDLALQVYCDIFQTTPGKAKKDIEELERSLKV